MDGSDAPIWFLGDLNDDWVKLLLKSIQIVGEVRAVMCQHELPPSPRADSPGCRVLVVHRTRLSPADVTVIEGWRVGSDDESSPRILLCYGPFARHAELERCGRSVDLMVPEATACETLPSQLRGLLGIAPGEECERLEQVRAVEVVSAEHALRMVLCEACSAAGYRVTERMWPVLEDAFGEPRVEVSRSRPLIVWDVPVLEPDWPEDLQRLSRRGPVIALFGFADRAAVERARERGASACLEVPVNLADLYHVLRHLARPVDGPAEVLGESAHESPFRPAHVIGRGRAAIRDREPMAVRWPKVGESPKMTP